MVESAIYFLVGFLSAALLALTAAPALTRRAFRLAAARGRLLAPLSEAQARADRDALRAQHAVEMLKIEQRMGAAAETAARARIELGRRDVEIAGLLDRSRELIAEIARQRVEIAGRVADVSHLEAELGGLQVALHDLSAQRDRVRQDLAEAEARIERLETEAGEARTQIAGLQTLNEGLGIALSDLKRSAAEAARAGEDERSRLAASLAASRNNATSLEERLANVTALHHALLGEAEGRAGEAARLRERLSDTERSLARAEKARDELAVQAARQTARLAEREAGLERAEATRRDEIQRLNARLEAASAREGALAERLRNVSSSKAAEDGALATARIERIELKRELDALSQRTAEAQAAAQALAKGDQLLRQSIAKLGRDILRGRDGAAAEEEIGAAQVMSFSRRDAHAGSPTDDHARERTLASEG